MISDKSIRTAVADEYCRLMSIVTDAPALMVEMVLAERFDLTSYEIRRIISRTKKQYKL